MIGSNASGVAGIRTLAFVRHAADRLDRGGLPDEIRSFMKRRFHEVSVCELSSDESSSKDLLHEFHAIASAGETGFIGIIGLGLASEAAVHLARVNAATVAKLALLDANLRDDRGPAAYGAARRSGTDVDRNVDLIAARQRRRAETILPKAIALPSEAAAPSGTANEQASDETAGPGLRCPLLLFDSPGPGEMTVGLEIWPIYDDDMLEERYFVFQRDALDNTLIEHIGRFLMEQYRG